MVDHNIMLDLMGNYEHFFKIRWPLESRMDWLKFKPFKLKAIVLTPRAVNQIPITGQAARKK